MSERFEVGEIAIIQNCTNCPERNGREVAVIYGYGRYYHVGRNDPDAYDYGYIVSLDGIERFCLPSQLRKKRPPQKTSSWDRIAEITRWSPKKVTA